MLPNMKGLSTLETAVVCDICRAAVDMPGRCCDQDVDSGLVRVVYSADKPTVLSDKCGTCGQRFIPKMTVMHFRIIRKDQ